MTIIGIKCHRIEWVHKTRHNFSMKWKINFYIYRTEEQTNVLPRTARAAFVIDFVCVAARTLSLGIRIAHSKQKSMKCWKSFHLHKTNVHAYIVMAGVTPTTAILDDAWPKVEWQHIIYCGYWTWTENYRKMSCYPLCMPRIMLAMNWIKRWIFSAVKSSFAGELAHQGACNDEKKAGRKSFIKNKT